MHCPLAQMTKEYDMTLPSNKNCVLIGFLHDLHVTVQFAVWWDFAITCCSACSNLPSI